MTRLTRWFLPHTPDVLAILAEQTDVTVEGLEAFARWSSGDPHAGHLVLEAEHAADEVRRRLQAELRAAFSTPIDAEDIYELSERLDTVINGAKHAVREADVLGLVPDEALATMAASLDDGVRHVRDAFAALVTDPDQATGQADAAIRCERSIEATYETAMARLLELDDVAAVIAWREMYRRYARMGQDLVRVGERVWYATVKG